MHVAALLGGEYVLAGMIASLGEPSPQHALLAQERLSRDVGKRLSRFETALEPADGNLAVSQVQIPQFEPANLTGAHPMG